MATINREFLINMLVQNPVTEKEIGYNSAVITILKTSISDIAVTQPAPHSGGINAFRNVLSLVAPTTGGIIHDVAIDEILGYLKHKNKLQAVKKLKEETSLGLKEAKDVIDQYVDTFNP